MSEDQTVGNIKEHEAIQIEWEVQDFFFKNLFRNSIEYNSPTFCCFESTWMLKLDDDCSNWILHAIRVEGSDDERSVKCKLGLKNLNGNVEYFPSWTDEFIVSEFSETAVICKQELLSRKTELAPSNALTILCTLRSELNQKSALRKPTKLIKLDTLSKDFKKIFTNKDGFDVILRVKQKEFGAHKTILMARSSVFASMFRHDLSENTTGVITIPDCDPDSFHEFLEYLYCGKLEDGPSFRSIFHLYSTSDKYDVQELKSFCVDYMEQCLTEDNVSDVAILADFYDETGLFSAVQEFFNKNVKKIVRTTQWENLMKTNYRIANKLIIDMTSKI